jgi:uncharacterized protein YjlB
MAILQDAKAALERATGIWRPSKVVAKAAVRQVAPKIFRFEIDGTTPNNPVLPLVVYKRAFKFSKQHDPAAVIEMVFEVNGWGEGWRDGIYDWMHFHARTHEVLGLARGTARVRFGGEHGREIDLAAGDVVVLPAGTGHQRIKASTDLIVVGAYPPNATYDERKNAKPEAAMKLIKQVKLPKSDPIYGKTGGIMKLWQARRKTHV